MKLICEDYVSTTLSTKNSSLRSKKLTKTCVRESLFELLTHWCRSYLGAPVLSMSWEGSLVIGTAHARQHCKVHSCWPRCSVATLHDTWATTRKIRQCYVVGVCLNQLQKNLPHKHLMWTAFLRSFQYLFVECVGSVLLQFRWQHGLLETSVDVLFVRLCGVPRRGFQTKRHH
jgi:hypothetical protein